MGVGETDPFPAEGDQAIQRRCVGAQRRRPEQKCLLTGPFVLVEQHHHQAGPAAEPAEQRAFADAGGRGDVIHGDRFGAARRDQASRGLQQQSAIAGRVAALGWGCQRSGDVQVAQPLAHTCTVTRQE